MGVLTKEQFENQSNWKCTYEEYKACYCPDCKVENCIHNGAYRRVPRIDGGLALCPKLKEVIK